MYEIKLCPIGRVKKFNFPIKLSLMNFGNNLQLGKNGLFEVHQVAVDRFINFCQRHISVFTELYILT
jgi:hypothetical protein